MAPEDQVMKVGFYGACHANALERMFAADATLSRLVSVAPIASCFEITEDGFEDVVRLVPSLDVLAYQPISPDYRGEHFATSRFIKAAGTSCKLVRFPYFHTELYWPFMAPMRLTLAGTPPFEYVDYHIAAMAVRGIGTTEATAMFHEGFDLQPYATQIRDLNLAELRMREGRVHPMDGPNDMNLSDFIEEHFKTTRLANTHNHPTDFMMNYIAMSLVERMPWRSLEASSLFSGVSDPTMNAVKFPIPRYMYDVHGLAFENIQHVAFAGLQLELGEYVERSMRYYRTGDPDAFWRVIEDFARSKPWFKELLNI